MHLLGSKSGAFSDGTGGSLLESDTLESLVHVQSIISGGVLQFLLFRGFWHFLRLVRVKNDK